MALMRYYIDKRTIAGLTTLQTATYAHGLPWAPNAKFIRYINTANTSTSWFGINAVCDATNVTLQNPGNATSPDFEVAAVCFHSIIQ